MSRQLVFTASQSKKFIDLYQKGMSVNALQYRMGCSVTAVRTLLLANGIKLRGNRPTQEQKQQLLEMYRRGSSLQSSADAVGVSVKTARKILRSAHQLITNHIKYHESIKDEVCRLFLSDQGISGNELARKMGIRSEVVSRILREKCITRRNPKVGERTYSINEDFFEIADSEQVAYAIGFLTADGCVTDDGKLCVGLAEKDIDTLTWLVSVMGSNAPIHHYTYKGKPSVRWDVSSKKICSDLARYGIVPRKTYVCKPWKPPLRVARHFYRGLLDGDGCWSPRGGRKNSWRLQLCGTFDVCNSFRGYVESLYGDCHASVTKKKNCWVYLWNSLPVIQAVANELYDGATVFMERKKERVDRLLQCVISTT